MGQVLSICTGSTKEHPKAGLFETVPDASPREAAKTKQSNSAVSRGLPISVATIEEQLPSSVEKECVSLEQPKQLPVARVVKTLSNEELEPSPKKSQSQSKKDVSDSLNKPAVQPNKTDSIALSEKKKTKKNQAQSKEDVPDSLNKPEVQPNKTDSIALSETKKTKKNQAESKEDVPDSLNKPAVQPKKTDSIASFEKKKTKSSQSHSERVKDTRKNKKPDTKSATHSGLSLHPTAKFSVLGIGSAPKVVPQSLTVTPERTHQNRSTAKPIDLATDVRLCLYPTTTFYVLGLKKK